MMRYDNAKMLAPSQARRLIRPASTPQHRDHTPIHANAPSRGEAMPAFLGTIEKASSPTVVGGALEGPLIIFALGCAASRRVCFPCFDGQGLLTRSNGAVTKRRLSDPHRSVVRVSAPGPLQFSNGACAIHATNR
jgi:hypothetical protein